MILFLDALAVMIILIMGIIGFKRGLVEELGRLFGMFIAVSLAGGYYLKLSAVVLENIDINPWVIMVFSFAVIFIIVLFIMRLFTRFIHLLLLSKSTKWLNRIMGLIFGSVKASLVLMVFLWALDISPKKDWSEIIYEQSSIALSLRNMRETIITLFHIQDPANNGEVFMEQLMKKQQIHGQN